MTARVQATTVGTAKPRRRGWAALASPQTVRRISQLGTFAFVAFIAIRAIVVGENGPTIISSWEAYSPFGGLESLYQTIVTGGRYVSHTHLSNLVIMGAVALTAVLARNAFCGWVCPLGFIQEMVAGFSAFVQKRLPPVRRAVKALKAHAGWLRAVDRPLRFLKYLVLAWALTGTAIYGVLVFRDYDPWAGLLRISELSFVPGMGVLAIVLVASLFVERPWCRYACPLGAATGLLGKLSPVYLKRESDACKACAICSKACPMGLPVHTATTIKNADCVGCLECVGSCPRSGALELRIGTPIIGK